MASPPYLPAATKTGTVHQTGFVGSTEPLHSIHRVHVQTQITEIVCHSAKKICGFNLSVSNAIASRPTSNSSKTNLAVSPK